jgi:Na+:H+ antiporter
MWVNITNNLSNITFHLPLEDPVQIFTVVLFIILLAPIVLRKLHIPSIIGLIIAGVIIGPNAFHILSYDSSIQLFGMVGLLYIMFMAGLDLDMNEFIKNRQRSLWFGLLTFLLPFGMTFLLCRYLLEFNWLPAVLIASTLSTHTLVAYPIASRLGITKNQTVTVAVGGTIITDTLVLLLLAVITGLSTGTLDHIFWIKLGLSILIFCFIVFFIFPVVGRWFFKHIKGDNTAQYIFVLALVFTAGLLAEVAGVEAIIGAFMAGLALNRLIPSTSPLMNRIEFVGNTLFIPFFLISVGMRVDLHVFLGGSYILILAASLLIVAIASKWIAAFFTQKMYHYTVIQRNLLFGLSSARAAATLAIVLVGFDMKIIGENTLNATVILILITCLVSSFITENAGRKLAITENELLPAKEEGAEKLVVPISNPDTIEQLIDFAVMLKEPRQNNPIYALTVVKDDEEASDNVLVGNKMLEKAIKHAGATDTKVQVITRVDLNVVSGIVRAMKEIMGTDVIIGWSTHIRTTERLFGTKLGSLITEVWSAIYSCNFVQPVNTTQKLVLVIPQNAQYETGFSHWVKKVKELSSEAGANILFCTGKQTGDAFEREIKKAKPSVNAVYKPFDDLEDFLVLSREISRSDLLIVISARKGTISYHSYLDNIPGKLNRHFSQINFILLYPTQQMPTRTETSFTAEDLTLSPLQEQFDNLNKIGKKVKKIFLPGKNDEE